VGDGRRPGGGDDLELGLEDARRAPSGGPDAEGAPPDVLRPSPAAPPGDGAAENAEDAAPDGGDASASDGRHDASRLPMVCAFLEAQLPGARCAVLRLDPDGARLTYAAAPSLDPAFREATDGAPLDPAAGVAAAAALRDQLVVVEDVAVDPLAGRAREAALATGVRACWALPLRLAGGEIAGVLAVHHERPHRPGDAELAVARTAAGLAELALGHDAEARALRDSERRARQMEAFRRSVMGLMELGLDEGSLGAFDQRLLEEAVRVIPGAETGAILRRAGDGAFRFAAVVGFDLERLRTVRVPPEAVAFGEASDDGRPRVVRDPPLHDALDPLDADTLATDGRLSELRAVLSVPIVVAGEMTAYLTLDNYEDPDAFGEDAIEMARIFAGQVASLMARFELETSLYLQAYEDPLTGLPNRAAFKEQLQTRLDAGRTYAGHAVLFVDLDNLKPINDSLGHLAGDEVLREVAVRIGRSVKHGEGFVARLGGDEFVVLLSGPHIGDDATATAERIIQALQAPIDVEAYEVRVGASIGISLCPDDGRTIGDLLRHADIAMYHAKKAGKGAFRFFADEMEAGARQRVMLEGALRDALRKDEFEVHYQPRIALRSGRIVAAEALVRWRHPEWGLVPPGRFVSLAEATNLIHPLGRRVLELACEEAVAWPAVDGEPPPRVSVNVSRHQLQRTDIVGEVARTLQETGLPADRLELEVLETSAMSDVAESARTLARLRDLGVHISLDDFGTGHSSLGWLQSLPVNVLKLDRTFVARLGVDGPSAASGADDVAILGAILRLGQALGLTVVAEGVEREAQLALLRQLGCAEGQGFLFSEPVPAADLQDLLAAGRVPLPQVP
jgi:diguanylate cyclase (GGDEF)-like protein